MQEKKIETSAVDSFVGEIIERVEEEEKSVPTKKVNPKVTKLLKSLKSKQDIKDFLASETKLRKECRKNAVTKKLEQSQWKALKSELKAKLDSSGVKELKKLIEAKLTSNKI